RRRRNPGTTEGRSGRRRPRATTIVAGPSSQALRASMLQRRTAGEVTLMATTKQRAAARRNVRNAAAGAKRKRTIAHLPKRTRTALAKQANKVKRQKKRSRS